ncbi:hypothetical protein DL96DRAFT_1585893 [Flagelloscypha sp. PMI_526]|nr:hypothetical protein DL96DRAFT_1585893 [Flagelloscypha sp. PMI_526]
MLVSPYSASHPNLRVFRWTTSEGPGPIMPPYASSFSESLGMYFSSVLADFAPRIEVIHLCPCPPNDPQGLWSNLDFTKLTEIRVDLAFCQPYQYHDLFAFLNNSLCLATLELEGCYPLTDGSDQHPISLLPPIPSLKELYMPIDITALKPEVMEKLATKVSKLVKLVLRLEDSTSGYAFRKFMRLDNIISAFESADPFHGSWSLRDFGVVKTDTKRAHFGKLVHAVAKKFPSIASFYGSGKLEVPSESLGEKEWSGKLDEMKVSNASHAIEEMRWHAQQELEFWACM